MNYEKMGICVTIAVVACLCGFAGIASSGIDIGTDEVRLPNFTSSTSTAHGNGYYEWCYQFERDCK